MENTLEELSLKLLIVNVNILSKIIYENVHYQRFTRVLFSR
jgi:hypothetical protein